MAVNNKREFMSEFLIKVNVEVLVKVDDDVSIEDATLIALFNVDGIESSISTKLNEKMQDIDVVDYKVISSELN
jgi:hypothetical protein